MSDLSILIIKLGSLFTGIIEIYIWIVIIAALLSFVKPDPYNPIVQFLYRITNPVYTFVRAFTKNNFNHNLIFGGLDLAPLIIIVGLQVVIILMEYAFSTLARLV